MRTCALFTLLSLLGASAAPLRAQTLADLAKKEDERRKALVSSGRAYSNKDLKAVPEPAAPAHAQAAPPDANAKPPAADVSSDAAGSKAAAATSTKDETKDPAFWAKGIQALRDQLERDRTYLEALQTRVNSLSSDFVSRDDPAQRTTLAKDREKALTELDRLKKAIVDDTEAIAAFEEKARRAGVPPGWLRL